MSRSHLSCMQKLFVEVPEVFPNTFEIGSIFFFQTCCGIFFFPSLTLLSLPAPVKKSDKGFKNVYKNKYPPFSIQATVTADNKSKVTCAHVETDEVFAVNLAARKLICHSDEHEHGDPS